MNHRAFVIEDHPEIAVLFSRALVEAGFDVDIIRNGREAIRRLERESPSLITLDMHLPGVDGGIILDFIRRQEHLKGTIVVVATADSQMCNFYQHKADLLLQKPITFTQMRDFAKRYKTLFV